MNAIENLNSVYQDDHGNLVMDVLNTETGEFVPTDVEGLGEEKTMAGIGRALKSLDREIKMQLQQVADQMASLQNASNKISEEHHRKTVNMVLHAGACLSSMHSAGLAPTDNKGRPYYKVVGCGKFAEQIIKRAGVNADDWNALSEEDQHVYAMSSEDDSVTLKTVQSIVVDKRMIMQRLKSNGQDSLPYFKMTEAESAIVFKLEAEPKAADQGKS